MARRWSGALIFRAPGERDECPACASRQLSDLDVLPMRGGRTGFACVCDSCGLVFANPLAGADTLDEFYSPSGAWGVHRHADGDDDAHVPVTQAGGTWARMFDPIRADVDVTAPPAGASALDFGCGEGRLLDHLQHCGWQTAGIEPAMDRPFRRHRRLARIPDEPAFDLVVALQVLEHVPNPLLILRQLAGACRIGGHLLVSVPRFDTLATHRDYRYVLNGRAHITAYTWPCLRTLLARAGWQAVAEPPASIAKGGGRVTTSRLRVVARRADGAIDEAPAPGDAARAAVRDYYARDDVRAFPARIGLLRLAARRADRARRRAKADRKAGSDRVVSRETTA